MAHSRAHAHDPTTNTTTKHHEDVVVGVDSSSEQTITPTQDSLPSQSSSPSSSKIVIQQQQLKLKRYTLIVSYDGTMYSGFQRQSSSSSSSSTLSSRKNDTAAIGTTTTTTTNIDDDVKKNLNLNLKRDRSCYSNTNSNHSHSNSNSNNPKKKKQKKIKNRGNTTAPVTVQETIEDTLEFYTGLDRQQLQVRFAGRTDKGVHARGQVVVVSLPSTIEKETTKTTVVVAPPPPYKSTNHINSTTTVDRNRSSSSEEEERNFELEEHKHVQREHRQQCKLWLIRKSINSRLPTDISIEHVSLCRNLQFDPRKDATRKQYSYTLRYREQRKYSGIPTLTQTQINASSTTLHPICVKGGPQLLRTAFDSNRVWICPWALDDTKLKRYCTLLTGTHDFSAFVHKEARKLRDNKMIVTRLDYERIQLRNDDPVGVPSVWEVRFVVEAKGFGRYQVRNMIGFLVDLCRGEVLHDHQDENTDTDCVMNFWKMETEQLVKQINAAPACGLCLEHVSY